MVKAYFVGVDVGTGSTRAALVDENGKVFKTHVKSIQMWNPLTDHYEQSSDDVWESVCECVRAVTKDTNPSEIHGIGFDATCSLVAVDKNGNPLTVSTTGDNNQNIILWMDHRASEEASFINDTKQNILDFVGGKVSLENETPKMLWLKRHLNDTCWSKVGRLFDLPDFLTWKSTGNDTRSLCSTVCKFNYDGMNNRWPEELFQQIGLDDLSKNNFEIIGQNICAPGSSVGNGLIEEAAQKLGLLPETPVSTSLVDAYAGTLCLLGCHADGIDESVTSKMALICGTSSAHISVQEKLVWAKGIWGPYYGAIFPGMFLHGGGQGATGLLLDFIVKHHPAYEEAVANANERHVTVYLNEYLTELAKKRQLKSVDELTRDIHIWPDYHGNRSPIADPTLKGMICGLTMSSNEENLALIYLAMIQAIAYGSKHIIDVLEESGRDKFKSLLICGGLSKNSLFNYTYAQACHLPVFVSNETEMVLVGSAMLGACAAKHFSSLEEASRRMGSDGKVLWPRAELRDYHNRKYKIFREMLNDQLKYRSIMS